jgi:predicted MFS family arabinose efflux permease
MGEVARRGVPAPSLWRHPDFVRLWCGSAVSLLGTQVSGVALPLTAVLVLGAGPWEMGVLNAARWLPYLLLGLVAGVCADRVRRRPLMVGTDLARAVLIGSLPLAAAAGVLRFEQVVAVAFGMGVLSLVFEAAYQAYLPALVPRAALVEGNSKLELARSSAQVVGPALAGGLVQLVGAPFALLFDAGSFVASAAALGRLEAPEAPPGAAAGGRRALRHELAEGVRWVFGHPLLRPIVLNNVSRMLAAGATGAVYVLYATRHLELPPGVFGLVLAAGGPGAVLGALTAPALIHRLGPGPLLVATFAAEGFVALLVPAAAVVPAAPVLLAGAQCAIWYVLTAGSVAELSLRQTVTPRRLQGRMNATMRSLNWGTVAGGALAGGALAERVGLTATLVGAALWMILASGWTLFSPLRGLRGMPASADAV